MALQRLCSGACLHKKNGMISRPSEELRHIRAEWHTWRAIHSPVDHGLTAVVLWSLSTKEEWINLQADRRDT